MVGKKARSQIGKISASEATRTVPPSPEREREGSEGTANDLGRLRIRLGIRLR